MHDEQLTLPFFPAPAPGETVYSVLCRIQARSGLQEKIILNALTGQRNKAPLLQAIPGYLNLLASKVPCGHPWQDSLSIVKHHSALPYFIYFDAPEQRKAWLQKVPATDFTQRLGLALGFSMYRGQASCYHPRFCVQCAAEQVIQLGFCYFRREHQLPWTAMCCTHGTVLSAGCSICGPYPIKKAGLSMPGVCLCPNGASFLPAAADLDDNLEPYTWLAEQSAHLVAGSGITHNNIRRLLRHMCMDKGYSRGPLLDVQGLAHAIDSRFGRAFLEWIGYPALKDDHAASWVVRLLCKKKTERRSPLVQYLLVIGVLFDSVAQFEKAAAAPSKVEDKCITASDQHLDAPAEKSFDQKLVNQVVALVRAQKGIRTIAEHLKLKDSQVAAVLRQHQVRLPLKAETLNRIGSKKLNQVRNALRKGMLKIQIQKRYGISEWTLVLIELDDPVLNALHRQQVEKKRIEKHRAIVSKLLAKHPGISRTEINRRCAGTYEHLWSHDRKWFTATVPKKQRRYYGLHEDTRLDWQAVDREKAALMQVLVDENTSGEQKPLWITETGLLKKTGLIPRYHQRKDKFVRVTRILEQSVESYEDFVQRKIKWAIEQFRPHEMISVNVLRRKAGLAAKVVRRFGDVVIRHAERTGVMIHAKSFYATSTIQDKLN